MKTFAHTLLFGAALLFSPGIFAQQAKKQAVIDSIYVDSIPKSQKGNLELLTLRIHNAFMHYLIQGGKNRWAHLPSLYEPQEGTIVPKGVKYNAPRPLQDVESITISYDPKRNPAIYGTKGLLEIMEIKFVKKKQQEELKSQRLL